ncbi:hypothetical protein KY330_02635 [Candidatus Woesearchaeota archaeon]|nr:hypothetical protein [Candidatus Woesearchaeota archaeon]
MVTRLLFEVGIGIASLVILMFAADYTVSGIAGWARKLGISDFLIGFIVVGIGTSLPELTSSVRGASIGEGGIVLGTLFGSLIGSYCLVLGIPAIIQKKIKISKHVKKRKNWPLLAIIGVPALLVIDGTFSRIDGGIVILLYLIYIYILWKKEGTLGKIKKDVKLKSIWKEGFIFLGALMALLLSAIFLVNSLITISRDLLGIEPFILAITVMGIASIIPDLLVEIRSINKGVSHIGMGNVLGSGMMNLTIILGIAAIIHPFTIKLITILPALIASLFIVGFVLYIIHKGTFLRKHGILLALVYVAFMVLQVIL